MKKIEPERRAELLRMLLASEVWRDVVVPKITEKLNTELQALVMDSGQSRQRFGAISTLSWFLRLPERDERRGRIKALQALLSWPVGEVAQFDLDKMRQTTHNEDEARYRFIAEYGHTIPYLPPAEEEAK
jgi:hypothetical protein